MSTMIGPPNSRQMYMLCRSPILLLLLIGSMADCQHNIADTASAKNGESDKWSLFDGQSLTNWQSTRFGGEGPISVHERAIVLGIGSPLTGVHWTGRQLVPTTDYVLNLEARRIEGRDFFCGLTFPYKESHCTLILGGWGGGLVGLSSLDGRDASENETTKYFSFEQGRWYRIRLRVRDNLIEAWLDEKKIVDCDVAGRAVSTRPEVSLSKPLGIAAYETKAEIRSIELRVIE